MSDLRFKKNIATNVEGLDFILRLRPVSYNLDQHAAEDFFASNYPTYDNSDYPGKYRAEKMRRTGFIAQEVEAVAKELGFDFSGVDPPKNSKDIYGLRYATFVVPLVKAVQEQQSLIIDQKNTISEQQGMIEDMENRLSQVEQLLQGLNR